MNWGWEVPAVVQLAKSPGLTYVELTNRLLHQEVVFTQDRFERSTGATTLAGHLEELKMLSCVLESTARADIGPDSHGTQLPIYWFHRAPYQDQAFRSLNLLYSLSGG
jgi:hypothetical protein